MRYVLGVDGGGSKAACLAAEETGRLRGYGRGGPTNTNYVTQAEAIHSLKLAVGSALEDAGLRGEDIEALCISAPMAPETVAQAIGELNIGRYVRAAEGETPRWAARFWIEERIGVTVDAGTGSLARGWSRNGDEFGAGGWGAILGDEGSAVWISLRAMQAVLQAYDGRMKPTALTGPVLSHFRLSVAYELPLRVSGGLVSTQKMIDDATSEADTPVAPDSGRLIRQEQPGDNLGRVRKESTGGYVFPEGSRQRESLTRSQVASLCPVVVEVAYDGDWKALQILEEAGRELGRLGASVIRRLRMEREAFAVVPFGGVFRAGELVLDPFRETIRTTAPRARVALPRFEPEVGAVLLALDDIGTAIDDGIVEAVEQSSVDFPSCRSCQNWKNTQVRLRTNEGDRNETRGQSALANEGRNDSDS